MRRLSEAYKISAVRLKCAYTLNDATRLRLNAEFCRSALRNLGKKVQFSPASFDHIDFLLRHATMDAPYAIASLPRPLDSESGRIQCAPVYGIRDSRKRKRHEIAAGIDGESVNIYNVFLPYESSSSRLLTATADPDTSSCHLLRPSSADVLTM